MNVLLHGCCLEELIKIPTDSIDMVFADLPYGVTANKWDTVIPFEPLWREILRIGKKNAAFVFTATQPFATAMINSQPKLFRYDLVWDKKLPTGFLNAKRIPLRVHELILVFYRKLPKYTPQKTTGKPYSRKGRGSSTNYRLKHDALSRTYDGSGYPTSLIQIFSRDVYVGNKYTHHPTQKPVALLEWLVKTYSNPGDVILDPTMGNGTTGAACANTQRYFVGIEKDATYFATATKRVDDAYALAIKGELFTHDGAVMQLDDLKNKVKSFVDPTVAENSAKKTVLDNLKGVVSKKDLLAMSLQEVVEILVTVMEISEVQALNETGETITLAELTRKDRAPRKSKPEDAADDAEGEDEGESDSDE